MFHRSWNKQSKFQRGLDLLSKLFPDASMEATKGQPGEDAEGSSPDCRHLGKTLRDCLIGFRSTITTGLGEGLKCHSRD